MKVIVLISSICLSVPIFAQSKQLNSGSAVTKGGAVFYYETRLEPSVPPLYGLGGGGISVLDLKTGTIHRTITDSTRKIYFGYDVAVESLTQARYQVSFIQLPTAPEVLKQLGIGSDWTNLSLPQYPPPKVVHASDVIALDLLVNNTTGQKIVDYITIEEPKPKPQSPPPTGGLWEQFNLATGAPRDFSVDDGGLRIKAPRLTINGKIEESSSQEATGSIVWFYFANRGRFTLSLAPHPELGFRKAGEVRGNSLTFSIGSDTFTLDCADRIAPGIALFNLYVSQDPAWHPANAASFLIGSENRGRWRGQ